MDVVPFSPEHADELRAVCIASAIERAMGFYQHMGFEQLSEYDDGGGYTFCMRL